MSYILLSLNGVKVNPNESLWPQEIIDAANAAIAENPKLPELCKQVVIIERARRKHRDKTVKKSF